MQIAKEEKKGGTSEKTKLKVLSKHFLWNSEFSPHVATNVLKWRIFLDEFLQDNEVSEN